MRMIVALALGVSLVPVLDASAEPRRRDRETYSRDRYEQRERSSTTDREGRCIRDNGRPMNSLDLNNRCDREEFWARFNDMGDSRR